MGATKANMPARTSRWSSVPSVLQTRQAPNNDPRQDRPQFCVNPIESVAAPASVTVPVTSEYRGKRRASRFDPQPPTSPVSVSVCEGPAHASLSASTETENVPPVRSQIGDYKPTMKPDLIANKGGEEERQQYQKELNLYKEARDRDLQQRLNELKSAGS